MKKKLVATLASVCLVAALGVGATLAYYTSTTEAAVNTFTVGDVDIKVTEPEWDPEDGKDLVPGAEVAKNPMITNTGASDGYMMLQVDGMAEMTEQGFIAMYNGVAGYNSADWTLVDEFGNELESDGTVLVDGYYVYKEKVTSGNSTTPLFTSVKLSESVTENVGTTYQIVGVLKTDAEGNVELKDDGTPVVVYTVDGKTYPTYVEAENYVLATYGDAASFVFDLSVKGYAIQANEIEYKPGGVYTWVGELTGAKSLLSEN